MYYNDIILLFIIIDITNFVTYKGEQPQASILQIGTKTHSFIVDIIALLELCEDELLDTIQTLFTSDRWIKIGNL